MLKDLPKLRFVADVGVEGLHLLEAEKLPGAGTFLQAGPG